MKNQYNTKQSLKKNLLSMGIAFLICSPALADYNESKWKDLNLSSEQQSQVKMIKQKHKEEMNRDIEAILDSEQKVKFKQIQTEQKAKWEQKK